MYTRCLFCTKPLGDNESLETFPVGRRLAFDPAKGRLWVVCKQCERWCLSPLEERWEAIEQAEKLYRDTRRRVSTDQIGLARLRDGTELVRIGEPLRPEFAAWRYGDQFGRRRRRQMFIAGAGITAVAGLVAGGIAAGVTLGGFFWGGRGALNFLIKGNPNKVVARVRGEDGLLMPVRRRHLGETRIIPSSNPEAPISVDLRFKQEKNGTFEQQRGRRLIEGTDALRVASLIVPHVNRYGANKDTVANAVRFIEDSGSPLQYLARIGYSGAAVTAQSPKRSRWSDRNYGDTGLFALSATDRIALEMALHEDVERRAMEGQLELLERAWREAETEAAIADNLLVPESVNRSLEQLHQP